MINNRNYDSEIVDYLSCSNLGRLAWYDSETADFIESEFNIHPLPLKLEYSLHDHQINSIDFVQEREKTPIHGVRGGILHLTMGLGKTLTALCHLFLRRKLNDNPALVVCSKTVMINWRLEIDKFFGDSIRVLYWHKDYYRQSHRITREELLNYHIVIINYDAVLRSFKPDIYGDQMFIKGTQRIHKDKILCINERRPCHVNKQYDSGYDLVMNVAWSRIVADESQRFANPKTKTYKAMMCLIGEYKSCLTGTPIRNYNTDIWAQLRWLGYNTITTAHDWKMAAKGTYHHQGLDRCLHNIT